uniref:Uncharacterized protein n=1 Tax=Ditylenchus dipsaci TaxID=166011 RepID=A0A915D4X3_9BILA
MKDANDCVVAFEKTELAGKPSALAACCPKFKEKYSCLKDSIVRECSGIQQKLLFDSFQKTFNYMRYTDKEVDLLGQGNAACDDLLASLAQAQDNSSPFLSDYNLDSFDDYLSSDNDTDSEPEDEDEATGLAVNSYSSLLTLFCATLFGQAIILIGF